MSVQRAPRSGRMPVGARRAVVAALGAVLLVTTACGAEEPGPSDGPSDGGSAGAVDQAALEEFVGNDLRMAEDGDFGMDISQLVQDSSAPGGTLLRTSYPQGSASRGTDGPDGGMQAYLELPEPTDTLQLSYQVRFPEGFDFVKGGKLPGLYGGTENNGGKIPDGSDGLSTRYMWRSGGDGEVYAYLPSSKEHGTSLGRGCWQFTPGNWIPIRQQVQLNSPGAKDGRVTVWQGDRMVLDKGGLEFRDTEDLQIDGVFFSTFFGGDDASWASPTDQHAEFADFDVVQNPTPPPGPPPASDDEKDCGTPGTS